MSSTKYELATELRQLTRGSRSGPICRMRKHELEAEIDRIKALKAMPVAEHPPAKPGPLGPRTVPTKTIVKDGVEITVPLAPRTRIVRGGDSVRRLGPMTLSFTDDTEHITHTPAPLPSNIVVATPPAKPHRCNCSKCPERAAKTPA